MAESHEIVIIGGGHAAAQLCIGLAAAGQGAHTHLVCSEESLPYQRPPLSKSFLKNPAEELQLHRMAPWYAEAGITVHRGDAAVAIDRVRRNVTLQSGAQLRYGRLVIATGARARRLPVLDERLSNVSVLRDAGDAQRLRMQLHAARHVTVLGGGFIGLEIAASAHVLGKAVTVIESAPRLLGRSVSAQLAAHVLAAHRDAGIDVRTGVAAGHFEFAGDRVVAMQVDGAREPVEMLVIGIGAVADDALAGSAGLDCDNGIVVDACLRASDPDVLAIGDCARFPDPRDGGRLLRLESVQNANDQALTALATLLGREEPYRALPWFWSEQGSLRLQMAGLAPSAGTVHRRPGAGPASFSLLHYEDTRLVCVESVNAPVDHLMSRKLLQAGISPPVQMACDPGVALKVHLAAAGSTA